MEIHPILPPRTIRKALRLLRSRDPVRYLYTFATKVFHHLYHISLLNIDISTLTELSTRSDRLYNDQLSTNIEARCLHGVHHDNSLTSFTDFCFLFVFFCMRLAQQQKTR